METHTVEKHGLANWVYKYKFPLLISFIVFTIAVITFSLSFHAQKKDKLIINPDFIYNTWKVEKLYKNSKLVINSNKYRNLFLQFNKDGTAEWMKDGRRLKMNFMITPDGSQVVFDDGMRVEEVETIFELKQNSLRFGKRNVNSHYEYVLTAVPRRERNIF